MNRPERPGLRSPEGGRPGEVPPCWFARSRSCLIKGSTMYYHDKRLQYPVRVESPDPIYARMLQQAIGGVEGEIRVCMQYFFQAWGNRAPNSKYRDMRSEEHTSELQSRPHLV